MKKGLFITFEGIGRTIFDSQVAVHAREMKERGIELEIWAFETRRNKYSQSLSRLDAVSKLAQSQVRLFRGIFIYIPFSEVLNSFLLLYHLVRLKPNIDFVHARADYSAAVCACSSAFFRVPIVWDCRGDSMAEFDLAFHPKNVFTRAAKWGYLWLTRLREILAAKSCSAAIFVSQGLLERKSRYLNTQKPTKIIPCGSSSRFFYFSPELRRTARSHLRFSPYERILLYSGGMVKWEGFLAYVEMFHHLNSQDQNLKLLVATPDVEKARSALGHLPQSSYKLVTASFEEMNAIYNAADFGCLLRASNPVNDVASPVKFGEYCLCGLPIIMNDSVKQTYRIAQKLGNLVIYRPNLFSSELPTRTDYERSQIAQHAVLFISKEVMNEKYMQIYALSTGIVESKPA